MKFVFAVAVVATLGIPTATRLFSTNRIGVVRSTPQRIASHNYPVETHKVQTSDGYILTMFRIPYSPKLLYEEAFRPIVFLEHGMLSSSDSWILNGPDNALAYLFADAGYDVWLGNNRGNTYSKQHLYMNPNVPRFWDFTWHEIATKDLPAMIDYALNFSDQKALHYVGHSQGTTVFFVLMSVHPSYNAKIKTSHMLAPVAYMKNMQSPLAKVLAPLLGNPSLLSQLIGSSELLPSNKFFSMLGSKACTNSSLLQPLCTNLLFLISGWGSTHFNKSLIPEILVTHPAGASSGQMIHYVQLYVSGYFRQFDYGKARNHHHYRQWSPPDYIESNIAAPVRMYYSANDYFAAVVDVIKMMSLLPNVVYSYLVPIPDFNHMDFLWSMDVRYVVYDQVVDAANYYEETGEQKDQR